MHVAPAWGMLQATDTAAAEIPLHRLQAAHLLLLPGYAFSYRHLGMPMVAWVCGRYVPVLAAAASACCFPC